MANVNAQSFIDESGQNIDGSIADIEIKTIDETAVLQLLSLDEEGSEYSAKSSTSKYLFNLAKYNGDKYLKKLEDFLK